MHIDRAKCITCCDNVGFVIIICQANVVTKPFVCVNSVLSHYKILIDYAIIRGGEMKPKEWRANHMAHMPDNSSSVSREQVIEAYLKVLRLIDDRVTPFLGKVTTRVLVQGAARRVSDSYAFLSFLAKTPYNEVIPAVLVEQLSGVSTRELTEGLDALLQECFAGLRELTGELIAPPIYDEVTLQLKQLQ
jgi:hypothetical protein